MTENRVVALRQKGAIDDPLTEILRTGARRLIAQAVKAEFETFLASTAELVLPDGRQRVGSRRDLCWNWAARLRAT